MRVRRNRTCVIGRMIVGVLIAGGMYAHPLNAQRSRDDADGKATFATYCASCHGPSGVGDGPLASEMRKHPADLTRIAQRSGGAFAADRVARMIDGRAPVKGHGGGDMPVWGDAFGKSTADRASVEEKIQRLVRFLESIQVNP